MINYPHSPALPNAPIAAHPGDDRSRQGYAVRNSPAWRKWTDAELEPASA